MTKQPSCFTYKEKCEYGSLGLFRKGLLLREKIEKKQYVTKDLIKYYSILALFISPFLFVPICIILGSLLANKTEGFTIFISILAIVFGYVIYSVSQMIGLVGLLSPFYAVWLPNLIVGLLSLNWLWFKKKYSPKLLNI